MVRCLPLGVVICAEVFFGMNIRSLRPMTQPAVVEPCPEMSLV